MSTPSAAIEHLTHARWDQAMDALLFAWRSHRAPELERAIADALAQDLGHALARGQDAQRPRGGARARARTVSAFVTPDSPTNLELDEILAAGRRRDIMVL